MLYRPVRPVVLERNKGDKRPQFTNYIISSRSHYVRVSEGVLKTKKYKDGNALYWDLTEKPKKLKVILASTNKIDRYDGMLNDGMLNDFMNKIFGIKSFMVTDESSVYDFDYSLGDGKVKQSTDKILSKIQKVYHVDVSKIKGLRLVGILGKIATNEKTQKNF